MRRLLVVVLIVSVIGGGIALMLANKPKLDDAREHVDRSWRPLVPPLTDRYSKLVALGAAVTATSPATGPVDAGATGAVRADQARWTRALAAKDLEAEVVAANALEAHAGRLRTSVTASARLARAAAVAGALGAFDQAAPPPQLVTSYNEAVRKYQRAREGAVRQLVAQAFDDGERASFEPSLPGQ